MCVRGIPMINRIKWKILVSICIIYMVQVQCIPFMKDKKLEKEKLYMQLKNQNIRWISEYSKNAPELYKSLYNIVKEKKKKEETLKSLVSALNFHLSSFYLPYSHEKSEETIEKLYKYFNGLSSDSEKTKFEWLFFDHFFFTPDHRKKGREILHKLCKIYSSPSIDSPKDIVEIDSAEEYFDLLSLHVVLCGTPTSVNSEKIVAFPYETTNFLSWLKSYQVSIKKNESEIDLLSDIEEIFKKIYMSWMNNPFKLDNKITPETSSFLSEIFVNRESMLKKLIHSSTFLSNENFAAAFLNGITNHRLTEDNRSLSIDLTGFILKVHPLGNIYTISSTYSKGPENPLEFWVTFRKNSKEMSYMYSHLFFPSSTDQAYGLEEIYSAEKIEIDIMYAPVSSIVYIQKACRILTAVTKSKNNPINIYEVENAGKYSDIVIAPLKKKLSDDKNAQISIKTIEDRKAVIDRADRIAEAAKNAPTAPPLEEEYDITAISSQINREIASFLPQAMGHIVLDATKDLHASKNNNPKSNTFAKKSGNTSKTTKPVAYQEPYKRDDAQTPPYSSKTGDSDYYYSRTEPTWKEKAWICFLLYFSTLTDIYCLLLPLLAPVSVMIQSFFFITKKKDNSIRIRSYWMMQVYSYILMSIMMVSMFIVFAVHYYKVHKKLPCDESIYICSSFLFILLVTCIANTQIKKGYYTIGQAGTRKETTMATFYYFMSICFSIFVIAGSFFLNNRRICELLINNFPLYLSSTCFVLANFIQISCWMVQTEQDRRNSSSYGSTIVMRYIAILAFIGGVGSLSYNLYELNALWIYSGWGLISYYNNLMRSLNYK
ncbi:hypothetical protein NEFER03_0440 [Nematocida sp. LUAm3]|nr:hypothetical protein NEFER03_0440 [Nematocida sp. LUAm3]KAI5175898.1 hypothetical protein NEFER02_1758 [Nematocida sp. LUAm2]KAI5178720.1 hypothetical protein NEFER01_1839 [Nematocida sp. LUAm1]